MFNAAALITWWGSNWLENAAESLSSHYRLPPIVEGSMVLAIGSSFPEISTAMLSPLLYGDFDLGVAAVTGSTIFNILVIPALSALLTGRIRVDRKLIFKDGQFYILSLAVL